MPTPRLALTLLSLSLALLTASPPAAAERPSDPLAPVVACIAQGRFGVEGRARLPESATARQVQTLSGPQSVSTEDGYRLRLTTAPGQPVANLMVEQSAPAVAAADRAAVAAQMAALAARGPAGAGALQRRSEQGVEQLALHQVRLDQPGPLSLISLLQPATSRIATLYLLNPAPGGRALASLAEAEALREEVVALVQGCLLADAAGAAERAGSAGR